MNIGIGTQRKINEFLGRDPYAMFGSQGELEAAYTAWREHVEKEDEARFAAALETARPYTRIVTKTWEVGAFHLRRGEVVYIKDYPTCPMVTRTHGSMKGMVAASNWTDIDAHTQTVAAARSGFRN